MHCRPLQLLHGRPTLAASHLTFRVRQGTHALLIFRGRSSALDRFCASPPEPKVLIADAMMSTIAYGGEDPEGAEGLMWRSGGNSVYFVISELVVGSIESISESRTVL